MSKKLAFPSISLQRQETAAGVIVEIKYYRLAVILPEKICGVLASNILNMNKGLTAAMKQAVWIPL